MARFFLKEKQGCDNQIKIGGADARQITKVLRLKEGQSIECVSKEGLLHLVEITAIQEGFVFGKILKTLETNPESPLRLTLFQGLAKGAKMDFVVQKAVELGAADIIPFNSRYTVVRLTAKQAQTRLERWRRIAEEAGKQCKRTRLPQIKPVHSFAEVLQAVSAYQLNGGLVILPFEGEKKRGLKALAGRQPQAVAVLIGPEGGFHEEEVVQLSARGAQAVTLGPRILRTETAGLVALSLLGYEWGDLG